MLPDPLHPAVVHFPIVLAVFLPVIALWSLLALRRSERARVLWIPVVVAGALLFGSTLLAKETGEDQEERVERVVSESVLHEHEEWGERMAVASGVAFALVLAGLLPGTFGRLGRWLSLVAAVAAMGVVIQVGDTGGGLVYEHGAASAYVDAGGSASRDDPGHEEVYEDEHEEHD